MSHIACLGAALTVVPFVAGISRATARTADTLAAISAAASKLSPMCDNWWCCARSQLCGRPGREAQGYHGGRILVSENQHAGAALAYLCVVA
jgi:hypothetical protein